MAPDVPLFTTSLERYHDRLVEAIARVVPTERFILGPEVRAFEEELASHLGVGHVVGVANGTDALMIGLLALGVRPGDEVVVPSFTFYATAEAVAAIGATPVFCDVDLDTLCVTAETVKAALTPRTKAVVPVDLFGAPAPYRELRELGVPVLEDAAQAAGARQDERPAGALGDAATFSFFPSKNLPCLGDGGAVATDDEEVAQRVRRLRFHGSEDKVTFTEVGFNSRLDEIQAAVLRLLLPELDGWIEARRSVAAAYEREGLGELVNVQAEPPGSSSAYHLYVVRHPEADRLVDALSGAGIGARGYYRVPAHRQPAMARFAAAGPELPATDEAARTHFALPMGTEMPDGAPARVVAALREAL